MVSPVEGGHPPQGTAQGRPGNPPGAEQEAAASQSRCPLWRRGARAGWRAGSCRRKVPARSLLPGVHGMATTIRMEAPARFVSRPLSSSSSALPETPDLCWVLAETLRVSRAIGLGAPGEQSLQVTGRGQARVLAARRWGRGSLPALLARPVVSAGKVSRVFEMHVFTTLGGFLSVVLRNKICAR